MKALLVAYLLTWTFIPWILAARKRPVSTLAWIWAVVLFPFVGPIAYLLFGVDRITRPRRRQQKGAGRENRPQSSLPRIEPHDAPLFRTLSQLSGFATSYADELRLLPNAATFYPALARAIENASHHAHVQFFTWEADQPGRELRDALIAAARRGVVVRVLVDRLANRHTKRQFFEPLVEAGGKIGRFRTINPLRHHFALHLRNHRKLQIIDGSVAFVGGMNVGLNYLGRNPRLGRWRDLQLQVRGGVVRELQRVFAEDWFFATSEEIEGDDYFREESGHGGNYPAQVVLGGPDLPIDAMADSFVALLNHAKRRAWIAAAYFAPDALLLSALRLAAARGADVRLLVTEKSDHPWLAEIGRSYFGQLLRSGVRIFEYATGLHHGKAMLLDNELLMVGSANCDNRSMRLNFELNVLARCPGAARELEREFLQDFAQSREITLVDFARRPFMRRAIEAMVRPLAPMT